MKHGKYTGEERIARVKRLVARWDDDGGVIDDDHVDGNYGLEVGDLRCVLWALQGDDDRLDTLIRISKILGKGPGESTEEAATRVMRELSAARCKPETL